MLDYLGENCLLIINEPARIREQARVFLKQINETIANFLEQGRILPSVAKMYWDWPDLWEKTSPFVKIHLSTLDKRVPDMLSASPQRMSLKNPEHFQGNLTNFVNKKRDCAKTITEFFWWFLPKNGVCD